MWDDTLFKNLENEFEGPGRLATNELPKMEVTENGKAKEVMEESRNHHSMKSTATGSPVSNVKRTFSMSLKSRKKTGLDIPHKPEKATERAPTLTKGNPSGTGCCGLVVAVYKHAVGVPKLFLTCDSNDKETKIWQALRATSAAPSFFEEISFGSPKITYIDGGLGYNSPCAEVDFQAKSIWKGRAVGCVVSIGTGLQTVPNIRKTSWLPFGLHDDISVAAAVVKMATSTTRVDNEMQRMYRDTETKYHR